MADVFCSYASADRARVEPIAVALQGRNFDVWWDQHIPAGRSYREVIAERLAAARCVVVFWSAKSAASEWVVDEADEGKRRRILVPVLLDACEPPMGFRQIEGVNLTDWRGDASHREFQNLVASVAGLVRDGRVEMPVRPNFNASVMPPRKASYAPFLIGAAALVAAGLALNAWVEGQSRLEQQDVTRMIATAREQLGTGPGAVATAPAASASQSPALMPPIAGGWSAVCGGAPVRVSFDVRPAPGEAAEIEAVAGLLGGASSPALTFSGQFNRVTGLGSIRLANGADAYLRMLPEGGLALSVFGDACVFQR
jgi:hypothetical protein